MVHDGWSGKHWPIDFVSFLLTRKVTMGGYLFEILYGVRFGIAQRGKTLDPSEMVTLLKVPLPPSPTVTFMHVINAMQVIYSIQLTYNTVIYFVKSSILFFYLRLGMSWFRIP